MKNAFKKICVGLLALTMLFLSACSEVDNNYGVKNDKNSDKTSQSDKYKDIEIPEISSDDTVMPKYLDISLYDVENYADVYLGSDFEYNITYCDSSLALPASYEKMLEAGWKMSSDTVTSESMILAGEKIKVEFVNDAGKSLIGTFYNSDKSSAALNSCDIVKLTVEENALETGNTKYGEFWVNGVGNNSSINDIIEALGTPSHFYAVSNEVYYFDYFLNKKDKRDRMTVYVNPVDDYLISIEVSRYN